MLRFQCVVIGLLGSLISPLVVAGQVTVALTGIVEDETGAPLPGATVSVVTQNIAGTPSAISQQDGTFTIPNLSPASYVLRIELDGFETYQQTVTIGPAPPKPLTVRLRVARLQQQVTVEADLRDEISTSDGNAGTAKLDDDLILELPIASDDVLSVIEKFVSPGGMGAEGPSIVVDGVPGGELDLPSSAIGSVRVNRNPYSAAFQYPGNGRVEVRTQRGHRGRRFHGAFQTAARNSVFAARNAFAKSTQDLDRRLLQSNLGGALGKQAAFYGAAKRFKNDESAIVNAMTLTGPVVANVPTFQRNDSLFSRLQWWPSALHTLYATYAYSDQPARNRGTGGFNLPERGFDAGQHKHKLTLNQNVLFPPSWSNNLVVSLTKQDERTGDSPTAPAIIVKQAFAAGPSQSFTRDQKKSVDLQNTARYFGFSGHTLLFGGRFQATRLDAVDGSNFGGTFEFASLSEFAAGHPLTFRINRGDPRVAFNMYEASGFVQDEIVLRQQLTLTSGVRFDRQSTVARNNISPRFALAFVPRGNAGTVFRGGAGIFHDNLPRSATVRSLLLDGIRLRETVIADPSYPSPFSGGLIVTPPASTIRVAPDIRSPHIEQASIGVEQSLRFRNRFSVEYLVSRGVHLFRSRNVNAAIPATGLRPEPEFLNINQVESTGSARGQSLTVSWQGRVGARFKPYVQYVLSKTTNDTAGPFSLPADNFDLRPESGPADFDRRHRVNVMGTLALPGDFRTGLLLSVASGMPYDITTGFDDNGDTIANDRPPGVTRNTGRGPHTLQLDVRFVKTIDLARFRREPQREKRDSLDLMVDVFNAINRTNVNGLVGVLSSPFFGRANSAAAARTVQFSLNYAFRR
jgi:Carboxypeptidase regulatory-like domain